MVNSYELSKFLQWSLMIFVIEDFLTIVFIFFFFFFFLIISITFWPIWPPAFFRCLSNLGTFMELWTTSFNWIGGVPVLIRLAITKYNCLSIPVLLLACDPHGFNKGHSLKFCEGSRVWQTPEEGWKTYRPKICR